MTKKIFHFVSTNILSGLENVVINISTLVKGYDFTYVSPNGFINKYLDKLGIKHISINKMTPLNVRKIIKKYDPDIVQGHDVKASISLAINHSICRKNHIRLISELHNDDPRMHSLTLRSILYSLSSKYYDKVIIVSQSIIDHYIFRKSILNKVALINNIVNPLRIHDTFKNVDKKWDCIFMGRLTKQKDPLKFINIIHKLKYIKSDVSSIVVGDGELYNEMIQLTKKYNLMDNIEYVGFQKNPYPFLQQSKILIIPSIYEGLPLISLESLILGIPVISAPIEGLKGIINKNCGNFASNKDEFVKQIILLLNDNNIYQSKVYGSIKQSKKVNNVNKFIKAYKYIYKELS